MDRYDIFINGEKVHEAVSEEEMEDITFDLADEFYQVGFPHPDDVEVVYIGTE